jgi:hypothetical protein
MVSFGEGRGEIEQSIVETRSQGKNVWQLRDCLCVRDGM